MTVLHCGRLAAVTCELAMRWARLPAKADRLYWARRIEVIIGLTRYRLAFDPLTEIPPRHVFGAAHLRRSPYLYSAEQLGELALEGPETVTSEEPRSTLCPHIPDSKNCLFALFLTMVMVQSPEGPEVSWAEWSGRPAY